MPALLRIVRSTTRWGVYLFYCGADGASSSLTLFTRRSTYAKGQAEFEFNVKPDEWQTQSLANIPVIEEAVGGFSSRGCC